MQKMTISESYPLSPIQQGMLFHYIEDSKSGQYILQAVCELKETLNIGLFKDSWKILVKRHPVLRTVFKWDEENEPLQIVLKDIDIPFYEEDLRNLSKEEQQKRIDEYLISDQFEGFDLQNGPLNRFTLFYLNKNNYNLIWSNHHIILDGKSRTILLKEVFEIYEALLNQEEVKLEKRCDFKEYIKWIHNQDFTSANKFWKKELSGFDTPTTLLFDDKTADFDPKSAYGEKEFFLPEHETSILRDWASHNSATLNTVIQMAWAILLSYYSNEKDVVFGTVRSCRKLPLNGIETMVGLFINTLPVRVKLSGTRKAADLLKEVRKQNLTQRPYDHTPLINIKEHCQVTKGSPLFESYIVFDFKQKSSVLQEQGANWKNRYFKIHEKTNYPMALSVFGEKELLIKFSFHLKRFSHALIERIGGHILNLLKGISANPDLCISDYKILTETEERKISIEWNNTDKQYEREVCLHELFERQVDRSPDAVALVYEEMELTYRELDQRSNKLAHYLRDIGIGPESLVGVFMERSLEMVIALYGILKSGGAYVPLDPEYPEERIQYMASDTNVPVILTQRHLEKKLPETRTKIISVDSNWDDISKMRNARPDNLNTENNLAYVIYTSGSTGKPKGVMNEHRGICNRLFWMQDEYKMNERDRVLQKTPFSFDVSVWEFFWPLQVGATLVIAMPGGHRDNAYLVRMVQENKITTMHFVPSMLQLFLEEGGLEKCRSLKRIICSGEALRAEHQKRFFERLKTTELHNLYGPTEAAVDVTYWHCQPDDDRNIVPIGFPIANTQMFILNTELQPVPIGCVGELHIGGVQVARGYLNRPELTAEKFIEDPFSQRPNARVYKTGDLGRYLADGSIEYIGRTDFQVKIRGLRVELGEIEAHIDKFDGIGQCAVVLSEEREGDQRLVAYYTALPSQSVDTKELRKYLQSCLPDYMIPHLFMKLDKMPLSPNGKLDRKALPKPKLERNRDAVFIAPRTQEEKIVADVWKELLRLDEVGVEDSFFNLGGHSLLLVRMLGKLKPQFDKELNIIDFFRYPTISKLVDYLMKAEKEAPEFRNTLKRAAKQKEFMKMQKKLASNRRKSNAR
jgi:amino acid adenylation domain-containing protein